MGQLNINMTPEFEKDLETYMREQGISQKSEAIRRAIHEAALRRQMERQKVDFRSWRGLALKSAPNPKPRFKNEDDLWS
jgi:metal-responsive CopG/Arc/MetJ family transcriptional regulator